MVYPNGYDGVTLAEGDVAATWEYMFDVNTGTHQAPVWLNLPQITGLNPAHAPKTKDITTYADQGGTRNKKTGSDFSLDVNLLKVRDDSGEFQAEWLFLKEAADSDGEANNVEIRYYDAKGASDAYQGLVSVSRGNRPSTGNDDPAFENFAFASVGRMLPIENPLNTSAIAVIDTILPTGRTVGQQVTLSGSGFVGVTSVHFGATNAPGFTPVDADTLIVTIPTGASGVQQVNVTKAAGTSANKAYTVA